MDQQSVLRPHLRRRLDPGFLVDPVEKQLNGWPNAAGGLRQQPIGGIVLLFASPV
jgi:hypothetical protein